MSWGEAIRLASVLASDPSSQVGAAVAKWDGPRSREWFVLADLFDLTHQVAAQGKKVKPYPRPVKPGKRWGGTDLSRAQVIALLNERGHNIIE